MANGETLVNAVLGAVVIVLLAGTLPFAPVLGGLLAGYLEGGEREDGIRVGALSGAIALVPAVLLGTLVANLLLFAAGGLGVPGLAGGLGLAIVLVVLLFGLLYIVGVSAVGGWLGNYVRYETALGS